MAPWYRWQGDDLLLHLRLQPRASRNGWVGPLDDAYKLRLTAAPVEGKANAELIGFLAKAFGVSKSAVCIESGETARIKRIRISSPAYLPDELHIVKEI
ncbi:MAG: YggU family protein [Gammaproteobacteria bacterium]|nr:YggU family protein [Gammaproteobacteria bacterium]